MLSAQEDAIKVLGEKHGMTAEQALVELERLRQIPITFSQLPMLSLTPRYETGLPPLVGTQRQPSLCDHRANVGRPI